MKTIKMLAILTIAFAASAASAIDSYLYWMVDGAKNQYNNQTINFDYATIKADNSDSFLNLYSPNDTTSDFQGLVSTGYPDASTSSTGEAYAAFTGNVTTFLVELWMENGTRVGWQNYNYSTLLADGNIGGSGSAATGPLAVSSVVPEPTSGLMMLLGLAALALKRRKQA